MAVTKAMLVDMAEPTATEPPAAADPVQEPRIPIDSLGMRIYIARKGLSKRRAAILLGVTHPTWSDWENDVRRPRVNELERIAETLGCDLDWLFKGGALVPDEGQDELSRNNISAGQDTFSGSDMDRLLDSVAVSRDVA